MPPAPKITSSVSWGQIMQFAGLICGFAAMFAVVKETAQNNEEMIKSEAVARAALETRLRSVETEQARADERFGSILSYLARIDARLERIEGN